MEAELIFRFLRTDACARIDVAALKRDGLTLSRNVFAGDDRDRLISIRDRIIAQIGAPNVQRDAQFLYGTDESPYSSIGRDPALIALAREVLGDNICLLPVPRVLMKDGAFGAAIGVHQDWPYFPGDTNKLNCFVALTPCTPANGGLTFYRRSHLAGPVERGVPSVKDYPQFEPVAPSLDVGDVLFANFLTWHSSPLATNSSPRIMLQVILQPADDPSSTDLVRGVRSHDVFVPFRLTPLAEAYPVFAFEDAANAYKKGDMYNSEKYARGLSHVDPGDPRPKLMLSRICESRGDPTGAAYYLDQAKCAFDALTEDMSGKW